jgi:hypothetical protein
MLGTRNYERTHSQSRLVDQGLVGECRVLSVSYSRLCPGSNGSSGRAVVRNRKLERIRWPVRCSTSARDEHHYCIWIRCRMRDGDERVPERAPRQKWKMTVIHGLGVAGSVALCKTLFSLFVANGDSTVGQF